MADKKQEYIVQEPLRRNGYQYDAGERIELLESESDQLVESGTIVLASEVEETEEAESEEAQNAGKDAENVEETGEVTEVHVDNLDELEFNDLRQVAKSVGVKANGNAEEIKASIREVEGLVERASAGQQAAQGEEGSEQQSESGEEQTDHSEQSESDGSDL